MRTLGLIGGMSWESTLPYYRLINEGVRERLGGLHSARLVLESVDFAEVAALQEAGRWDEAGALLAGCARRLEAAGAGALVICCNTMHRVAPRVEEAVSAPLLHIADAIGEEARRRGLGRVGLLGTRYTMEHEFIRGPLRDRHGLDVLVPGEADRGLVHRVIYGELCRGEIRPGSRRRFLEIIDGLVARGAGAVVLGCTEIGLMIRGEDRPVPLLDTLDLHARAAVAWALS